MARRGEKEGPFAPLAEDQSWAHSAQQSKAVQIGCVLIAGHTVKPAKQGCTKGPLHKNQFYVLLHVMGLKIL